MTVQVLEEGYWNCGLKDPDRFAEYRDGNDLYELDWGHGWKKITCTETEMDAPAEVHVERSFEWKLTRSEHTTMSETTKTKVMTSIKASIMELGSGNGEHSEARERMFTQASSASSSLEHKEHYKISIKFHKNTKIKFKNFVAKYEAHCHRHKNGKPHGQELVQFTVAWTQSIFSEVASM